MLSRDRSGRGPVHLPDPLDPQMPWLAEALDPALASDALRWSLPTLGDAPVKVQRAELMARKAGRRALVLYDLVQELGRRRTRALRLVGKTRARGLDVHTYRLQRELVARGFGADAGDGIAVPAPLGMVGEWRMWLQEFVPGRCLAPLLSSLHRREALSLMARLAGALNKLHMSGAPAERTHTLEDELQILEARLSGAREARPDLSPAIARVMEGCHRLASRMEANPPCGIHRDFHPGQIMLADDTVYLLDLDLYAEGDPALDVGNFTAHLTECAIREMGDPHGMKEMEVAFQEEILRLAPALSIASLEDWHTLSLARHIGLSTTLTGRSMTTDMLVDHVSDRLSAAGALPIPPPPGATTQPPRGSRSILMLMALAALGAGPSAASAQTVHEFTAGAQVASVYDSNIDREPVAQRGLAGVVTSGILRYRMQGDFDLRGEYEVGFHRYAEDTPWNRVSHKLRLDGRMEAGDNGILGLVTEIQIRGSGDERSLGDQLQIEPSYTLEFGAGSEVKAFGTARIRRDQGPGEGEWNAFAGVEFVQELGETLEMELGGRFERNQSPSGRRNFQGPRGYMELTRVFPTAGEIMVGIEYRDRRYLDRLIDTRDGDEALRRDSRWTPVVEWEREFMGGVILGLEFEYEQRMSNDPDKQFGGYTLFFNASRFW